MEILTGRLRPGESTSDHPKGHTATELTGVDECFLVLEGRVELRVGDDIYILEQGDSAYFWGTLPHVYRNVGEEDLVLLFAIAPPAISR